MAQAAAKVCDICARSFGLLYCIDCEQLFCNECKISHLRIKACRGHQFLTETNIKPKQKVMCEKHNEDYMFYCLPCDIPVCRKCMIDFHKNHKISELYDAVTKIKFQLRNQLELRVEVLKNSLDSVKQGRELFKKDVESAVDSVKRRGEEIKNVIDRKIQELVQSITDESDKKTGEISHSQHKLEASLDKSNELHKAYCDALNVKNDAYVVETMKNILSECNSITTFQVPIRPSVVHETSKIVQSDIVRILGTVTFSNENLNQRPYENIHIYQNIAEILTSSTSRQQHDCSKTSDEKVIEKAETGDKQGREITTVFDVAFEQNKDTERLKLQGTFRLHVSNDCLMLEDLKTKKPRFKWYYEHLRKYGNRGSNFIIVAGRRSDSGEGTFVFLHDDPVQILRAIDTFTKR